MEIELNGNKLNLTDDQVKEIVDKYGETSEKWKPEANEKYYCVDSYGNIEFSWWNCMEVDSWIYEQGNCFETEEEAEKHLEYLNAVATLKNSSDFVPSIYGDRKPAYYIYYDTCDSELSVGINQYNICTDIVFYKTEKEAEDSIKKYRKEWNIVFGIEG